MKVKIPSPKIPTEHQEQVWLFQWAALMEGKYPALARMYATPNESYGGTQRDIIRGSRLKQEGRKAGVPDVFLPVPVGKYHGLYIELKRIKGGVVSDEQKGWIEFLKSQGYAVEVAKGWEIAKEIIISYLNNKPLD